VSATVNTFAFNVIPLPPNPEPPPHHYFAGWYLDEELTQPYDGRVLTGDTELYAKFELLQYRIWFATGLYGAEIPEYSSIWWGGFWVTALTAVDNGTLPVLAKTGYTFLGWFMEEECTEPAAITSMTGDVMLFAGWEAVVITVTFYASGQVYMTVSVPYGATLAQAVSAAQSNTAVISAIYSDPKLQNALSVNTVLTTDMNVYAEVGAGAEDPPGFFRKVGYWFGVNWPYFPVSAGCFLAGMLTLYIILAKKGVF